MTIQAVTPFVWPHSSPQRSRTSLNVSSAFGLSASTHRVALIFRVPSAFDGTTLTEIQWRTGNVTTSAQLRIGVYTVSSNVPTSTTYGGSAYVTRASVAASTAYTETLGTPATLTKGDVIAVVIEPDGTTPSLFVASNFDGHVNMTKSARYDGATWTHTGSLPAIIVKTSAGYLPTWTCSPHGISSSGFNTGTNSAPLGDENALYLTMPFTARIEGIWYHGSQTSGANYDAILYDSASNVLASCTGLNDLDDGGDSGTPLLMLFSDPVDVDTGTVLRAALKPTNATNTTLFWMGMSEGGQEVAFGWPLGSRWSYRIDGGGWTESTVRFPSIGLVISGLDDGVGGGGGRSQRLTVLQ